MTDESPLIRPLAPADVTVRTWDHPGAGGRTPQPDDEGWAFQFLLDDGTKLRVCVGRESRNAFRDFMLQDEADDAVKRLIGDEL